MVISTRTARISQKPGFRRVLSVLTCRPGAAFELRTVSVSPLPDIIKGNPALFQGADDGLGPRADAPFIKNMPEGRLDRTQAQEKLVRNLLVAQAARGQPGHL